MNRFYGVRKQHDKMKVTEFSLWTLNNKRSKCQTHGHLKIYIKIKIHTLYFEYIYIKESKQ